MRPTPEIEALARRVNETLAAYKAYRAKQPVTGDYAFDLTLPELATFAEILDYVRGKRRRTPYLDEYLRSAVRDMKDGV